MSERENNSGVSTVALLGANWQPVGKNSTAVRVIGWTIKVSETQKKTQKTSAKRASEKIDSVTVRLTAQYGCMTAALLTVRRGEAVRSEARCVCQQQQQTKHMCFLLSLSRLGSDAQGATGEEEKKSSCGVEWRVGRW